MPNQRPGLSRLDVVADLCRELDHQGFGTVERNRRIAVKLGVSRGTVRNYLATARRLGLLGRADPHRSKWANPIWEDD